MVSFELLLWSELVFLWAVLSYGVSADPLPEDRTERTGFSWAKWRVLLIVRCLFGAGMAAVMSRSVLASLTVLFGVAILPMLRLHLPLKLTSGIECCFGGGFIGLVFWEAEYFHLHLKWGFDLPLTSNQISALCILGGTLFFVVRGGTYVVRGFLKIADVLPRVALGQVDTKEVSRGRLIGNIERLILTIVVAAGSYAALGFLVAAKGLIRANEFENKSNREFTEYFLVGSLASVLVALCAGLIIRFVLMALWPELLSLHMQSSD